MQAPKLEILSPEMMSDPIATLAHFREHDPVPFNLGSFLVRGDGHTVLIDTGYGVFARTLPHRGAGQLLDRIRELGVALEDIDIVIHTHLHPDHVGWDIDEDRGGALTFPNATVYASRLDLDYWFGADPDPQRVDFVRKCITPPREATACGSGSAARA